MRPSRISMVEARETTSREAKSFAVGAYLHKKIIRKGRQYFKKSAQNRCDEEQVGVLTKSFTHRSMYRSPLLLSR